MKTVFYTGKGDDGKSRIGKKLMCKDNPLIGILGQLDGLNSWLGFARVEAERSAKTRKLAPPILEIQELIFIVQAEVAALGFGLKVSRKISKGDLAALERIILTADREIPPITKFIVPGESELSARLDVARTEARALERAAVASKKPKLSSDVLAFLNRLSSALFALARLANVRRGRRERHPSYQ